MTCNRILAVLGVAAALAGCTGGQAETVAPHAAASQVAAPAEVADTDAAAVAQTAVSGAIKAAIGMHAQASVPAIACGLETEASLDAGKSEVRQRARAEGVDDATFDQLYAAGLQKTRARWDSAPAAKRASACAEWKTMTEQAEAQARTL